MVLNAGSTVRRDSVPPASIVSTSALRKRLTRSREPSNDDVAEVAIELQRADRRPAARGQAHQLAVGAGDMDQVGRASYARPRGDAQTRRRVTTGWRGSNVTTAPPRRSAT